MGLTLPHLTPVAFTQHFLYLGGSQPELILSFKRLFHKDWRHLGVSQMRLVVLLASNERRSGLLLNILQSTGQAPWKRILQPKISITQYHRAQSSTLIEKPSLSEMLSLQLAGSSISQSPTQNSPCPWNSLWFSSLPVTPSLSPTPFAFKLCFNLHRGQIAISVFVCSPSVDSNLPSFLSPPRFAYCRYSINTQWVCIPLS